MTSTYDSFAERATVMNWKLFDAEMEEVNPLRPSRRVRKNGVLMAVDVQRPHPSRETIRPPMPYDILLDARRVAEGIPRESAPWAPARCKCGRMMKVKSLSMCKRCAERYWKKKRASAPASH